MFLRKNNTLKWNWIGWGAIITILLVLLGIFGFDKILFDLINNPSCNVNVPDTSNFVCDIALLFSVLFDWKLWLFGTFTSVMIFFIVTAIRNENDFRYAFIKIKNSYAFYVFSSIVFAGIITKLLKIIIGRARPIFADPMMFNSFSDTSVFHSMPSGHTAMAFAGLVMIGMLYPKIKWATWTLAIIAGVSRIYVGVHWPADVILAAFIGMVCADIVKYSLKRINSK